MMLIWGLGVGSSFAPGQSLESLERLEGNHKGDPCLLYRKGRSLCATIFLKKGRKYKHAVLRLANLADARGGEGGAAASEGLGGELGGGELLVRLANDRRSACGKASK